MDGSASTITSVSVETAESSLVPLPAFDREFIETFKRVEYSIYLHGIPTKPERLKKGAEYLVTLRTLESLKSRGMWVGGQKTEARRICGLDNPK